MESKGNAFLIAGQPSSWGVSSSYEVVAKVNETTIPLYYSPNSFGEVKRAVVDAYLGMKDGPVAAEVTGANELTVIYKGGYYLSWGETTHIFIENYDLTTGVAKSRYNFTTKKFDLIQPGDTFWTNGPQRGNYRAEYISETYPLYSTEVPKGYNDSYKQALKYFSHVLNPLEYSLSITSSNQAINTVSEGGVIQINLSTKNVPANSVIYWQISGTQGLNVNDLADKKLSGSGKLDRNGKLNLTKTLINDFKTEGDETLQISFFSDKALKRQVTTASVTIKDTSTDTLYASVSTVLPASYANLTLTGSLNINGTGNKLNNTIEGNSGGNLLDGGLGKDLLTGLAGADTFKTSKLTDSLLATYDRITDFTFGEDKIQGPISYSGKLNPQVVNLDDLKAVTITKALTTTAFKANTASLLTCGSQFFIALNDSKAGFDFRKDAIIELTGFQGGTFSIANMASSLL